MQRRLSFLGSVLAPQIAPFSEVVELLCNQAWKFLDCSELSGCVRRAYEDRKLNPINLIGTIQIPAR